MKPDMCNITPEPNSTAYFINSSQQIVCVCMSIPSTSVRIRLYKNVTAAKNHTQRKMNVGRFLFFAGYTVSKGIRRLIFLRTELTVMELALSNGPNRLRFSHHSPVNG
jgi:predicted metal-binding membrane protein